MHVVTVTFSETTFFVTKNYNVVIYKDKNITRISDNIHNNGGWQIAEKYDDVVAKFAQAYAQLT